MLLLREEATLNWTVHWGGIHMIWQTPHWYQHADTDVVFVHHYFLEKELLFFIHIYVVLHYYTQRGTASRGLPNRLVPGCILARILRFHACNAYSSKQQIHPLIIDGWHSATITSAWSSQDGEIGYVDTKRSILLSLAQTEHQTQIPFLNRAKLWFPFRVGRAPIVHSVK